MHHIMFDVDGTLVESYDVDSQCFIDAVKDITGLTLNADWSQYQNVTDSGILDEVLSSNRISNSEDITASIKQRFLQRLSDVLSIKPLNEVNGAANFLKKLKSNKNLVLSIATGGWKESALLKLQSAGIEVSDIPLASANDHYSREEIMKVAMQKANAEQIPCTYFGDGIWDKHACRKLGFDFVLVGNKLSHEPSILNFNAANTLSFLTDLN